LQTLFLEHKSGATFAAPLCTACAAAPRLATTSLSLPAFPCQPCPRLSSPCPPLRARPTRALRSAPAMPVHSWRRLAAPSHARPADPILSGPNPVQPAPPIRPEPRLSVLSMPRPPRLPAPTQATPSHARAAGPCVALPSRARQPKPLRPVPALTEPALPTDAVRPAPNHACAAGPSAPALLPARHALPAVAFPSLALRSRPRPFLVDATTPSPPRRS
jgi:hypothetical protein